MKNYIEMFFKDGNFKINTKYIVKTYKGNDIFVGFNKDYNIMVYTEESCEFYDWLPCNSDLTTKILTGVHKIEKIKPKTLMEQLKEQGHGWLIRIDGVLKIYKKDNFYKYVKIGDIKLTKSEAEREIYRRKLEFEMQEWARENDCLDMKDGFNVFNHFNIYVKSSHQEKVYLKFRNKVSQYNGWRD